MKQKESLSEKLESNRIHIPNKIELLRKGTYGGIVRYVSKDGGEVRVCIFDEDGRHISDVFSINLFKGKKPEADDDVKYHTWQLKNGQYGGYFEVLGYLPVKISKKDMKEVSRILDEWRQELNEHSAQKYKKPAKL